LWKRTNSDGYGKDIFIIHNEEKFYFKPHRVSIFKYKGVYPELVRHKCNNRNCICPDHLEGGSYRENNNDKFHGLSR